MRFSGYTALKATFKDDILEDMYNNIRSGAVNTNMLVKKFKLNIRTAQRYVKASLECDTFETFKKTRGRPPHIPMKVRESVKSEIITRAENNQCIPSITKQKDVKTYSECVKRHLRTYLD